MQTENDTSKPEDSPKQEAREGCSGATCSASFVPPEQYIDALNQRFRKAVDAYSSVVLGGGYNPKNSEVTAAHSRMTGAADDIYAFREEERKRQRIVADISSQNAQGQAAAACASKNHHTASSPSPVPTCSPS